MKLSLTCFLLLFSCFFAIAQAPPVPPPPGVSVGLEENKETELRIWNSNSQLQIDASAITEDFTLSIFNINGQLLLSEKFSQAKFVSISTATFPQGIIIVQAATENKIYTRKLFLK